MFKKYFNKINGNNLNLMINGNKIKMMVELTIQILFLKILSI